MKLSTRLNRAWRGARHALPAVLDRHRPLLAHLNGSHLSGADAAPHPRPHGMAGPSPEEAGA